jgi:hypothetical protein
MKGSTMTNTFSRDILVNAMESADIDVDSIRDDYSGRGMFGERCFGVVMNPRSVMRFAYWLAIYCNDDEQTQELGEDLVGCASTDSMGYDTIVYFPDWTLSEDMDRCDGELE